MASSTGATDLGQLIKSMTPILEPEQFVFAQTALDSAKIPELLSRLVELDIKMLFREREAWTVILPKATADEQGLEYIFPCRQITLNIHSSLDAVGFIAAVSTRLTKMHCGVNVVAAYYHDHLFVPAGKENIVVKELEQMAVEHK